MRRWPLSVFWMTYIELMDSPILLELLCADHEGDWYQHLFCIQDDSLVLCYGQSQLCKDIFLFTMLK